MKVEEVGEVIEHLQTMKNKVKSINKGIVVLTQPTKLITGVSFLCYK